AGPDLDSNRRAIAVAERESDCRAVVGVHPHYAERVDDALVAEIRQLATNPVVVGLGETGLDFHYDHSPRDRQVAEFHRFAALARELGLPLVVHSRNAAEETLAILREERIECAVLHCFTYGAEIARRTVDAGWHVSFSGIVTFKNAGELREAARVVPLDRLLVETDSPYLAPEPKRGGRNEPARVADVVACLAGVLGRTAVEIGEATAENAARFFRRASS
ncbi:MAG: TatD family hydrolase, partial [Candidatus Binatia bacterium]